MVPKFRVFEKDRKFMCKVEELVFKENGDLRQVSYYREDYGEYMTTSKHDELILMQSTGHKDKHGKDIYIGDILEDEHQRVYRVEVCWRCELVNSELRMSREIGQDLEIIGSVYENPELLDSSYM